MTYNISFSIIIPCYNAALHLQRTLDSILCQGYNNYEIILIDDGSEDNTLKIIQTYATKYSCIKYIHQLNKGVSTARNAGIKIATGSYLAFIDADDTISPVYFNTLNKYIANSPDIIFFGFKHYQDEHNATKVYIKPNSNKILFNILTYRTKCNLWNGVYKTSIIHQNHILFDENTYYNEDREFFIKAIVSSSFNRICIVKDVLYNYLFNPTSVMRVEQYSDKRFSAILASERIYNIITKRYGADSIMSKAAYNFLVYNFIVHKKRVIKSGEYALFKELFHPYKKLVIVSPPFVSSVYYLYNLINLILNKKMLMQ